MGSLREFEKKKKEELADLEVSVSGVCEAEAWYEAEVAAIEKNFTAQLDQYEKELEVGAWRGDEGQEYRSACFVKAEKKEAETEAAVEMMVVRHLSHVMRRSRFSRLRLTA